MKLNKKDQIERLQDDPRAQMEESQFTQLAANVKLAAENVIKADLKTNLLYHL